MTFSYSYSKRPLLLIFVIVLTGLLFSHSALAENRQDVDGAGDHPAVKRVAGSLIRTFERDDFAQVILPAGPLDLRTKVYSNQLTVEGEHLRMIYDFTDPEISPLRVHRSYLHTLEEQGFDILFNGEGDELVSAGRSANFLTEHRHLAANGPIQVRQHVYYILAQKPAEGLNVSVSTYLFAGNNPRGTGVTVNVVTEEAMEVSMEHRPLTSNEMADSLIESGRVAIQDILFAFDSDEILPESADSLSTIASLLQEQPELGLLVVGHTDDVGDFDYNLRLSLQRATAVVSYLQHRHNVDSARLQASGAGMMAPIASNRNEAGRSLNRRVELVEIRTR
ncbi:OmpA family protein [Alkalimonas collagenimarina]|uniref:OmpA family protein n=1 Tax=Alkalimonas collagenimarina TaxID=400390 RepID=A0ABT9GZ38_9GAMM|nr:OmpA family protein [Alkalimonas collagenimarina]MDP4536325.1 OmpA family protein [Alkalimonas collagenimarina]